MSNQPLDHLRVEIAPGAVLSADPDTWPWVDITEFIHKMDEITYTAGERDEAQSTLPSVVTLSVDNTDGRFSPRNPLGLWFGQLSLNTPLRLFWDADPVSEIVFVSEWPPRWDRTAIQATTAVSADGLTRRMEQGAQPLGSPLFRALSTHPNAVAYWPCEDNDGSTSAASPIMGVEPLQLGTTVTFGSQVDGLPGSASSVLLGTGAGRVLGRVPNHTPGDVYVVELAWRQDDVANGNRAILEVNTTSPDLARWRMTVDATNFILQAYDSDGVLVINDSEAWHPDLFGRWVRAQLRLAQGVGVAYNASIYAVDAERTQLNSLGGSINSGREMGRVVRAGVGGGGFPQERFTAHIAILTGTTSELGLTADDAAEILHPPFHGFTGELAADRFERLCDEEGLSCTVAAPTGGMLAPSSSSNATTPDSASLDITGDIDVRTWIQPEDWADGAGAFLVEKWEGSSQQSWALFHSLAVNGGGLGFQWTTDGTSGTQATVRTPDTLRPTPPPFAPVAVRATLDVDDGGNHTVTFYTGPSLDGPWAEMYSETNAGTTSIFSSTADVQVWVSGVDKFGGRVRASRVYNGIGGTLVASPDFTAQTIGATSFDDAQGNTWTLGGDAAIVRADDSMPMGPQQIDTLVANLRDIPVTDGGRLTEHRGGFRYRTRTDLYNQGVAFALDGHGRLSQPPQPTDDDQQLRNDVTAQSPSGTSVRAVDQDSVDTVDRYGTRLAVNPETPDQLQQIAYWALHLGTVDDMRWPRINLALHKDPGLIPAWLALRFGDRITLDQTLSQLPGIDVDQLIIGSAQRFTQFTWDVSLNCVPAQPYTVAVFDSSRFDTAGSETSGSFVAGTDTSLTVVTTATRPWVNTTDHPGEFPFEIEVSGVVLNVTAISGATSPQTFTVDQAPVNGVEKTIPTGSAVSLSPRPAFAL